MSYNNKTNSLHASRASLARGACKLATDARSARQLDAHRFINHSLLNHLSLLNRSLSNRLSS